MLASAPLCSGYIGGRRLAPPPLHTSPDRLARPGLPVLPARPARPSRPAARAAQATKAAKRAPTRLRGLQAVTRVPTGAYPPHKANPDRQRERPAPPDHAHQQHPATPSNAQQRTARPPSAPQSPGRPLAPPERPNGANPAMATYHRQPSSGNPAAATQQRQATRAGREIPAHSHSSEPPSPLLGGRPSRPLGGGAGRAGRGRSATRHRRPRASPEPPCSPRSRGRRTGRLPADLAQPSIFRARRFRPLTQLQGGTKSLLSGPSPSCDLTAADKKARETTSERGTAPRPTVQGSAVLLFLVFCTAWEGPARVT